MAAMDGDPGRSLVLLTFLATLYSIAGATGCRYYETGCANPSSCWNGGKNTTVPQGRNSVDIKNLGPFFGPKLEQTFEDVSICLQVVDTYILFNLTSRASFRANFRAKNYVN